MNFESKPAVNDFEPHLEGEAETDEAMLEEMKKRVEEYYRKNKVSEELIQQFKVHNQQVEEFVKKFSEMDGFNEKEKEIAVIAAIFHDVTKGWGDFLKHGEEGGKIANEALLEMGITPELARSVKLAVERHMGQEG